ncbi:hypothetical protein JAAARDRAFT_195923 [Jaapia argillacea MUCL 33604]|uniref:Uncharacterized protein n=1 Tax=Jaapia argillacea MUCL 33604 TaxID=933084 RepID=A0A067PXG9_9AGAM|nr:hypothetical protein JAAARDRAFT_195923 [Jaapia argillacea MUCL 33604]
MTDAQLTTWAKAMANGDTDEFTPPSGLSFDYRLKKPQTSLSSKLSIPEPHLHIGGSKLVSPLQCGGSFMSNAQKSSSSLTKASLLSSSKVIVKHKKSYNNSKPIDLCTPSPVHSPLLISSNLSRLTDVLEMLHSHKPESNFPSMAEALHKAGGVHYLEDIMLCSIDNLITYTSLHPIKVHALYEYPSQVLQGLDVIGVKEVKDSQLDGRAESLTGPRAHA